MTLLVRERDVPRVAQLVAGEWTEALEREGLAPVQPDASPGSERGCPACGFSGPRVDGACGDCGLMLG